MYPEIDVEKLAYKLKSTREYLESIKIKEVEIYEIYHLKTGKLVFKGEYIEVKELLRKMYKENLTLVDVDTMLSIGKGFIDVIKNISAENVFQITYKKELLTK
ncbi:hypothetical protein METROID_208 [Staphylococcus phage Metroid]|nr:hypothetical protein METROID_208 [Staphylococcus phage Metroid]